MEFFGKRVFADAKQAIVGAWEIPLITIDTERDVKISDYARIREVIIDDKNHEVRILIDKKFHRFMSYLIENINFEQIGNLVIGSPFANSRFVRHYIN